MPEPSYQEVVTSAFIADYMRSRGYMFDPLSGVNVRAHETHLVFRGEKEPIAYIRVDLDGVSYGNGRFEHTCGHNINLTSILTLAEKLKREGIDTIGFIFQPAEEGPGNPGDGYVHPKSFGGGQYLRERGIYEKVPALISTHIDTSLAQDEIRLTLDQATAAAYRFTYRSQGVIAHAALPSQGKNPIQDAARYVLAVDEINKAFAQSGEYGLLSASQINTPPGELNSLAPFAEVRGISRITGRQSLELFRDFLARYDATSELEAPPVINDNELVKIAREEAVRLGYKIRTDPARFRDESGWAGRIVEPWVANPSDYASGVERVLHFFTPSGNPATTGLHTESFSPDPLKAVDHQVNMLYEIVKEIK